MSPEEAIRIITEEQLYIAPYNWFEIKKIREDEVGIIKKDHYWQVYTASERANPSDIKEYDVIEDALDDFVQRIKKSKLIVLEFFRFYDQKNKKISNEAYIRSIKDRQEMIADDEKEWLSSSKRIYQMME